MVINQGDIFWIELDEPSGSEPGYLHPHVIIQNNLFNRSRKIKGLNFSRFPRQPTFPSCKIGAFTDSICDSATSTVIASTLKPSKL